MANITKKNFPREVITIVEDEKIVLELDKEEANVLMDILKKVGGPPKTSRRCITDKIYYGLRDIGVFGTHYEDIMMTETSMYFN